MKVNLKCFSSLAENASCTFSNGTVYDLNDGQTVRDLARQAGVAGENIKIVFVNQRKSRLDRVLRDGDRVGMAPAVGGM